MLPNVIDLELSSPLSFAPKTTFSFGADYTLPTDFGEVIAHSDFNWRSRTYFRATPPLSPLPQQAPYGLLNASLTANIDTEFTVSVFGKNLANKHYFTRTSGVVQGGYDSAYIGDPRTYGISAGYRL